ncbi:MAG: exodeoxyribonuclease VII small subunit [Bacteroidales bacterium]|nr:exodeoxyribonuclease VII small subunit [Bacteroidales bacterium]
MEDTNITYTQAYQQLQELVEKMENSQIQVDELSENIKKAGELIAICKNKLKTVETDVEALIKDIEQQNIE